MIEAPTADVRRPDPPALLETALDRAAITLVTP